MAPISAAKKKQVSQNELRLLMIKQKLQTQKEKKNIESPLAKRKDNVVNNLKELGIENGEELAKERDYRKQVVFAEIGLNDDLSWSDHINSKIHKENISKRKPESSRMTERLAVATENLKRPLPKQENIVPPKKLKGILKNVKTPPVPSVPVDFFQSPISSSPMTNVEEETEDKVEEQPEIVDENLDKGELPKGFFDDPMLDAKIRKEEYVSSLDEEFMKFQKEIKEENMLSEQIMADNEDEATYGRQVEEIDEQIKNWSKVIELEKKREKVMASVSQHTNSMEIDQENENSDGSDLDDLYIDWRSKS